MPRHGPSPVMDGTAEPGERLSLHRHRGRRALPPNSAKGRRQREPGQRFWQWEGRSAPCCCALTVMLKQTSHQTLRGANGVYLKSCRQWRCGAGERIGGTSCTISIVCCGHHWTPPSAGVPAITKMLTHQVGGSPCIDAAPVL